MDDIIVDIIEGVLDLIIEGLFGSKKSYRSSYKKPTNLRNEYSSYETQSRNLDGSLYRTKKPKPMYGPGSVQEEKESEYKNNNKVTSAYMGATVVKKAATIKTEPLQAEPAQTKPLEAESIIKEPIKEVKPEIHSFEEPKEVDSIKVETFESDYYKELELPTVPTIDANFGSNEQEEEEIETEDFFHTTSRKDAIKLEIMLLSYMYQEDDGKISSKEKRAIKKHFMQYRGELDGRDVNEVQEQMKLDKSLTNIRAFINSRNIDNTTITNSIRALKEIENGSDKYSSIISRIERSLLESMGY